MATAFDPETRRIHDAYSRREGTEALSMYTFENPAFAFQRQDMEWAVLEALREAGVRLPDVSLLDVGCGTGELTHRFLVYGVRNATGLDLMEASIERGRRLYPNVELVAGSAAELPFDDASFDLVSQFGCLCSVLDMGLRRRIAGEMWRVLRPGGHVLSYDLRPSPAAVRAAGRLLQRIHPSAQEVVPTDPLDLADVTGLFPGPLAHHRLMTLNFMLAGIAGRSRVLARALALLPPLRTHRLVLIRKPPGYSRLTSARSGEVSGASSSAVT